MLSRRIIFAIYPLVFGMVFTLDTSDSIGQSGGQFTVDQPPSLGDTNGGTPQTGNNTGNNNQNVNQPVGGLGGGGGRLNEVGDIQRGLGIDNEIEPTPNARYRGFVGITSENIGGEDFQFVGPSSEAGEGSFGGGGGGQGTQRGGGFGGGGGGGNRGFNNNGGLNNNLNQNRTIRSRLVPSFQSRPVAPRTVSTRFNSRISRSTISRNTNGIRVRMQGDTAIMTGFARNAAQVDMLRRQLRLEPGVYRIQNRVQVPR